MLITTERLKIYPVSNEQIEQLIEQQVIPELKSAYLEMLNGCVEHPTQRQWYAIWNLELSSKDGVIVGNLSFKGLDKNGMIEIGYGTNKEYEGQGYMTEAVLAVVQWASKQEGVKSIEAETEEDNIASKRVLEKSGFLPNGILGEEGPRYSWRKM